MESALNKLVLPHYSGTSYGAIKRLAVDSVDRDFKLRDAAEHALSLTGYCCPFCGKNLLPTDEHGVQTLPQVQWDLMYPATRWGIKTVGNFFPLDENCNNEKSGSHPEEYYRSRLVTRRSVLYPSLEEFSVFLAEFTIPFRKNFPEYYELTTTYDPDATDGPRDKEIFEEYFLKHMDFNSQTPGRRLNKFHEDYGTWAEARKLSYENRTKATGDGIYSCYPLLQEVFIRKFGEERTLASLTTRDFRNFVIASLYSTLDNVSSSRFGSVKAAAKDLAVHLERPDFEEVLNALPGRDGMRDWYRKTKAANAKTTESS